MGYLGEWGRRLLSAQIELQYFLDSVLCLSVRVKSINRVVIETEELVSKFIGSELWVICSRRRYSQVRRPCFHTQGRRRLTPILLYRRTDWTLRRFRQRNQRMVSISHYLQRVPILPQATSCLQPKPNHRGDVLRIMARLAIVNNSYTTQRRWRNDRATRLLRRCLRFEHCIHRAVDTSSLRYAGIYRYILAVMPHRIH